MLPGEFLHVCGPWGQRRHSWQGSRAEGSLEYRDCSLQPPRGVDRGSAGGAVKTGVLIFVSFGNFFFFKYSFDLPKNIEDRPGSGGSCL